MEQVNAHIISILGVGATYSAVVVSEIKNISRFEEGKKIVFALSFFFSFINVLYFHFFQNTY